MNRLKRLEALGLGLLILDSQSLHQGKDDEGRYKSWWEDDKLSNLSSVSYGRWRERKWSEFREMKPAERANCFIVPDLMTYSDYSGSCVEASNMDEALRQCEGCDWAMRTFGGYGTTGAVFGVDGILRDTSGAAEWLLDALEGLEDYPVIDESEWSRVEMEAADEAWSSWAAGDFRRELRRLPLLSESEEMEELFDGLSESKERELFEEVRDRVNTYWEDEGGGGRSMWVRVERVAAAVTEDDIRRFAAVKGGDDGGH